MQRRRGREAPVAMTGRADYKFPAASLRAAVFAGEG
jgi:hypothetical protein